MALHDLEMVVPFASTLNTCLAFCFPNVVNVYVVFYVLSSRGLDSFFCEKIDKGAQGHSNPTKFSFPPSGVACLNLTLGLMQVSSCNSKQDTSMSVK